MDELQEFITELAQHEVDLTSSLRACLRSLED